MFGFKDIGRGMEGGSGSLAIGSFLLVPMPNGFPVTGGVSQAAGLGFPGIGDIIGNVPPEGGALSSRRGSPEAFLRVSVFQ